MCIRDRLEPQVGGHIYDRAEDGSECRWARVLAYDPPNRVVFSWDISPYWQLEHRNLDRHGPGWEGVRDGIAEDQGWPLYLARYADVVAGTV